MGLALAAELNGYPGPLHVLEMADRLQLTHIIERINARGAMIKVLAKPHLDLTTPIGRGFIAFLSALAEDERQRIVKRANDGRAAARKRGVHMGRKPKLTELQRRVACEQPRARVPGLLPESGVWPTLP
jgi:DNA invertase Pin-like site-specific DNA recombinase